MKRPTKETKKKMTDPSLFFLTFHGEPLRLILNTNMSMVQTSEDETTSMDSPMAIEGVLVDEDERYYYIGTSPTNATKAVDKDSVIVAELIETSDQLQALLEAIPDDGSIN